MKNPDCWKLEEEHEKNLRAATQEVAELKGVLCAKLLTNYSMPKCTHVYKNCSLYIFCTFGARKIIKPSCL